MAIVTLYSDDYIESLFQAWYSNGSLPMPAFRTLLEENGEKFKDAQGRIPSLGTLTNWADDRSWRARRDLLDAKVATQIDDDLVALKVNMLREQASQFRELRKKSHEWLMLNGFDSSSAAVAAFIKSAQEERISLGLSKTIQKLAGMDDDELTRRVRELAERASGETIDSEELETEEEEDTST